MLELHDLLKQFLSLLIFNEKVIPSTLVDYKSNFFSPCTPPRDSSLHMYIARKEKIQEFAKICMDEVKKRFNNARYHSCIDGHASAIVFTTNEMKEDIILYRPEITAWFVVKGNLTLDDEQIGAVETSKETIPIKNKVVVVKGQTLKICKNKDYMDGTNVVIPFSKFSNESLLGTFVDLAISYKYIVRFISDNANVIKQNLLQEWQKQLYTMFLDSIIAHSPYFNSFGVIALQYTGSLLTMLSSDISGRLLRRINFVANYINPPRNNYLNNLVEEKQGLWDERVILPLKSYFKEFLTEADIKETSMLVNPEFHFPTPKIPWTLNAKDNMTEIVTLIRRILTKKTTLVVFPFYLLMHFLANDSFL